VSTINRKSYNHVPFDARSWYAVNLVKREKVAIAAVSCAGITLTGRISLWFRNFRFRDMFGAPQELGRFAYNIEYWAEGPMLLLTRSSQPNVKIPRACRELAPPISAPQCRPLGAYFSPSRSQEGKNKLAREILIRRTLPLCFRWRI
jgi:hypothetical protein